MEEHQASDPEWTAGIDGARGGWVAALWRPSDGELRLVRLERLAEFDRLPERPAMVCLDMPIGLADAASPGGRLCDRMARGLLKPRGSSVFSPPVRAALAAQDHAEANAANRASSRHGIGLSIQAFNLFAALRQVDALMTPARQRVLREAHPELVFRRLNGGVPVMEPKRTPEGRRRRVALLAEHGPVPARALAEAVSQAAALKAMPDDVLDAVALAVAARDILAGRAVRLPDDPPRDARGLLMEIWG